MNLKPLNKQVYVEIIKQNRTDGGLVLPENSTPKQVSLVKAIADNVTKVKVGDKVGFVTGYSIPYELNKLLTFVHEDQILCIFED